MKILIQRVSRASVEIDKQNYADVDAWLNQAQGELQSQIQLAAKHPNAKGVIYDGFPRTNAQADALDQLMQRKDSQINAMIALEVDDEVLVGRLLERGKTSGRADDADESIIRERVAEYYRKTDILKDFYKGQDRYFGVNGVGTIQEITARLSEVFDRL